MSEFSFDSIEEEIINYSQTSNDKIQSKNHNMI